LNVTQITHHDLDGYGAVTVVGSFVDVARVVHVSRYADVAPVVEEELKRLKKAAETEMMIITDLGLEAGTVKFIRSFAAMNLARDGAARHRLIVLDHHASSAAQLAQQGIGPTVKAAEEGGPKAFDLADPHLAVLIDESRSATRMAYDHRDLFATRTIGEREEDLQSLVHAIDAVDLWKKDRPIFPGGLALDEVFWDNVSTLIPLGHPWHDRFISALLLAISALLREGNSPAEVESRVGALRTSIVDDFLAGYPNDDRGLTTRMRVARALADSPELFRPLSDGTLLSFGLDAGTFQRVSDMIMELGKAKRVVNVQRTGMMSFRSNDETALEGARKFRGGGHKDAAGGKLPSGSVFSMSDAVAQVEPVLNPPPPDPSKSPFAALQNWKG
jgi:oligoribonuclease NrnB/cAMP/cGMP phosphodiesterase (DHH superfamily)